MSRDQIQTLRDRIAFFRRVNTPPDGWKACLDWIESQIAQVINDPAFGSVDGPVTREEFERVVRG